VYFFPEGFVNFKHGMSHTRAFKTWLRMIDRCKNDRQGTYGKKGIAVCVRWLEAFENFYADMGEPTSPKHSIDRIDVNGGYSPENCPWATRTEQARNTTRNTFLKLEGMRATIAEWSERTGIKPATICQRLASGQSAKSALTTPVRKWRLNKPWIVEGLSRSGWYRKRAK
jgi:hypothetical protein